jgi:hypothetical protein
VKRYLYFDVSVGPVAVARPLRAVNRPHAGTECHIMMVWTDDDLEKLHIPGLISIADQIDDERPTSPPAPGPYVRIQGPKRYAAQAAKLRGELKRSQRQLHEYRHSTDDVISLKKADGGVNLDEGDIAVPPDVGFEILETHVNEVQTELNALEDWVLSHDIPGTCCVANDVPERRQPESGPRYRRETAEGK